MSLRAIHNRLLRTVALLLVPAVLIVGSNFIANSKTESQPAAFHKVTLKSTAAVPQTVIFEADEELEDDDLSDAHVLLKNLPGLHGAVLAKEPALVRQICYSPYPIEYSLNSRAPPAL